MIIKTTKNLKQCAVVRNSRSDRVVSRAPSRTIIGPHIVPIPLMRTSVELILLSFLLFGEDAIGSMKFGILKRHRGHVRKVQH
jgi:hypothetical protein